MKYLPKKAHQRLKELAVLKKNLLEDNFDSAVSKAEIHAEMKHICFKYYPKRKGVASTRYAYWRDGGYLRTKRDQNYQWKNTHKFVPPKLKSVHRQTYINGALEIYVPCVRCGEYPETVGDAIHFMYTSRPICTDCFNYDPHKINDSGHPFWGWTTNHKQTPLKITHRALKEEEEDDEESL